MLPRGTTIPIIDAGLPLCSRKKTSHELPSRPSPDCQGGKGGGAILCKPRDH